MIKRILSVLQSLEYWLTLWKLFVVTAIIDGLVGDCQTVYLGEY